MIQDLNFNNSGVYRMPLHPDASGAALPFTFIP
jgi:hypothetical protein